MNHQKFLPQVIGATLGILLLVGCGSPAISPTMSTSTSVAPPPSSGLKAGHWEGKEPPVSFDITSDGTIHNFKLIIPFLRGVGGKCTLEVEMIDIKADVTFVFTSLVKELDLSYLSKSERDFLEKSNLLPTPMKTDSGEMFEAQRISGKFEGLATVSGAFTILICEKGASFPAEEGIWKAEWREP